MKNKRRRKSFISCRPLTLSDNEFGKQISNSSAPRYYWQSSHTIPVFKLKSWKMIKLTRTTLEAMNLTSDPRADWCKSLVLKQTRKSDKSVRKSWSSQWRSLSRVGHVRRSLEGVVGAARAVGAPLWGLQLGVYSSVTKLYQTADLLIR